MSHRDNRSRIKPRNLAFILLAPALLVPFWSCDDEGDNTDLGNGGNGGRNQGGTSSAGTSSTAGTAMTAGSGGMAGGGGDAGSSMSGGTGGGTGGTGVFVPPDGGLNDAGVLGCALPGADGGFDISQCCVSMCTAQTGLEPDCSVPVNCAADCETFATNNFPQCSTVYDAYIACFGNEPTESHFCFDPGTGPAPQQKFANQVVIDGLGGGLTPYAHGCAAEECAYYNCLGVTCP